MIYPSPKLVRIQSICHGKIPFSGFTRPFYHGISQCDSISALNVRFLGSPRCSGKYNGFMCFRGFYCIRNYAEDIAAGAKHRVNELIVYNVSVNIFSNGD